MDTLDDAVLSEGTIWIPLDTFSRNVRLSKDKIKRKIYSKRGKNSRVASFESKNINGRLYIASGEEEKFKLEAHCLNSGEYYTIIEVARMIAGDDKAMQKKCFAQFNNYKDTLIRKEIMVNPPTCLVSYIKKEWVEGFARKIQISEAASVLGIERRKLWALEQLPDDDYEKMRIKRFGGVLPYMPVEEFLRQAKIHGKEYEVDFYLEEKIRQMNEGKK